MQDEEHLRLWCYSSGTQGVIVAEDFHPQNMFLEMQARVSGPQDRSETVQMRQIAPRRYQATVPLWGPGRYQVMAIGKSGDRTARAQGGFIVPYSPEYLRFRSNPIVSRKSPKRPGATVLNKDTAVDDIYKSHRQPKQSSRPIFDWFLVALAFLLPLDVAFRRIQIDRHSIASLFGFGRLKGDPRQQWGRCSSGRRPSSGRLPRSGLSSPIINVPESERTKPQPPTGGATGDRPPAQTHAEQAGRGGTIPRRRDSWNMKRKRQQEGKQ